MTLSEKILFMKNGAQITISGQNSEPVTLRLNIGDAMLNGNENQVWLENNESGKRLYLRRKPEGNMVIGPALFGSRFELAKILEQGDFYVG